MAGQTATDNTAWRLDMRVFSIKYSLTLGIQELEGTTTPMGFFSYKTPSGYYQHLDTDEFYLTEEEAIIGAKMKRDKQILAAQRRIDKLRNHTFKVIPLELDTKNTP